MKKRKPILIVDNNVDSQYIIQIFETKNIEYVKYDIKKFEESCCGDIPTTKAPSVIAVDGIFKGKEAILNYLKSITTGNNLDKSLFIPNFKVKHNNGQDSQDEETESMFW